MSILDQQVVNVTRTAVGALLQTVKYLGLPQKSALLKNTTLNQKFNVQANVMPSDAQSLNFGYLVIGNKGHYTVVADDGSDETDVRPHRTNHNGLYNHIPFALREVTDDFTQLEREKYRIRIPETHNSKSYWAYYARRVNLSAVIPQLLEVEIINGVEVTKAYVPTLEDLNPTPPTISNTGVVVGSPKYISASAIVEVKWTKEDIAEIVNAHRVRTGSTRSPVISEIGLVTGIDKLVAGAAGGGGSFDYTEVIGAQISVHVATNHPIAYNSNGLTMVYDIGASEPMLGDTALNVAQFAKA
ncbi:virion structural protein [Pseudomonas phage Psa21]|uniref:Virion structural protein n=1 Tax=Pseudomonas phage Psa21 TaxID=2530023 RepID=A0A481W4X1_9CAUD|nr:virion structural protein [Pseudomonas phage Psa21]QBJ02718.1 virion structural protein [Pseudomonas phage Psa21]